MSSIFAIYLKGYRKSLRQHPLTGIYYIFNLIIASLLVWPFTNVLEHVLGRSRAGAQLFETLDLTILIQTAKELSGYFPILPVIISYVFIFIAVSIFLSGGTIFIFSGNMSYKTMRLYQGGISFYMRFLRLFLLLVLLIVIISLLYMIFSAILLVSIGISLMPVLIAGYALCLGMLLILFDYIRIIIVLKKHRKIRRAIGEAVRFIFRNFFPVIFLYLLYFLPVLLLLLLHFCLPDLYHMGNIIAFIYGQLFIIFRSYLRLSLLAGQTLYAQSLFTSGKRNA